MIEKPNQYTILVSGATGQQGGAVARHLKEKGFKVRALTRDRNQEKAQKLAQMDMEVVEGEFLDRPAIDRALDGVYGAFSVQNSYTAGVEGEVKQGKAFARAAKDAGVKHFVYSSVGGAERKTGIPHFESKWEIENEIRKLDLPATILRPVFFMDNWVRSRKEILEGRLLNPLSPDTPLQQIAVDDIGIFTTQVFINPEKWINKSIELAGDELTMSETAKIFSEAQGNDVSHSRVSWNDWRDQSGEENTTMFRWFEESGYRADIASLRRENPTMKSLTDFLQTNNWRRR